MRVIEGNCMLIEGETVEESRKDAQSELIQLLDPFYRRFKFESALMCFLNVQIFSLRFLGENSKIL